MKTHKKFDNKIKLITPGRWTAYMAAAAASTFAGVGSAEAEIHYSGRLDVEFPPDEYKSVAFPLDQPGDSISFVRGQESADFFAVRCPKSGAFLGSDGHGFEAYYVFRLGKRNGDQYISEGPFSAAGLGGAGAFGTMIKGGYLSLHWRWNGRGTGFVGFRFNNGSGNQYGWARVRMDGPDSNFSFTLLDYAWADLGEPIRPGQTSSTSSVALPKENSLGLLALGAVGVELRRQRGDIGPGTNSTGARE